MSGLILTITNAGRAALVNAANTGTNPVLMASVGVSATAFTPSPGITSLPGEIKRITTIAGEAVADDTIHVTVRDESADVYTVRSFGLYLADGTLFGVYSQANPIMEKSAQAMLLLAIDVIFADIDATQITFGDTSFLNPPATTERQGVVELATESETTSGTDASRAITPKGLKAAVTSWLNDRFGSGAPSLFVKSILTAASAAALRAALEIRSAALKDEGHGSGLDADLLDGLHASAFAQLSGADFTGNVSVGGKLSMSGAGLTRAGTPAGTAFIVTQSGEWIARGTGLRITDPSGASTYVSFTDTAIFRAGNRVWDAGNDGAGSGLDADLLDGLHASAFAHLSGADFTGSISTTGTISAGGNIYMADGTALYSNGVPIIRQAGDATWLYAGGANGYVFRNRTNTATIVTINDSTGIITRGSYTVWDAGNDGAGSGLDADLLDGLHASSFVRSTTAHGYAAYALDVLKGNYYGILHGTSTSHIASMFTPTGIGGWYRQSDAKWLLYWDGAQLYIGAASGNRAWHAGNDGSGSGLDADLLDGLHASAFAKLADFVASKSASGYCKLPNGMIIQAGRYTQYANTTISISFPLAFPSLCMGVVTSGSGDTSYGAEGNTPTVVSNSVTTTGFQSINANDNNTTAYWIAFGY